MFSVDKALPKDEDELDQDWDVGERSLECCLKLEHGRYEP